MACNSFALLGLLLYQQSDEMIRSDKCGLLFLPLYIRPSIETANARACFRFRWFGDDSSLSS